MERLARHTHTRAIAPQTARRRRTYEVQPCRQPTNHLHRRNRTARRRAHLCSRTTRQARVLRLRMPTAMGMHCLLWTASAVWLQAGTLTEAGSTSRCYGFFGVTAQRFAISPSRLYSWRPWSSGDGGRCRTPRLPTLWKRHAPKPWRGLCGDGPARPAALRARAPCSRDVLTS